MLCQTQFVHSIQGRGFRTDRASIRSIGTTSLGARDVRPRAHLLGELVSRVCTIVTFRIDIVARRITTVLVEGGFGGDKISINRRWKRMVSTDPTLRKHTWTTLAEREY